MRDQQIRDRWRAAGGSFHGPHVETGTMEEAKLLPFLRGLYDEISRLREALTEIAEDPDTNVEAAVYAKNAIRSTIKTGAMP